MKTAKYFDEYILKTDLVYFRCWILLQDYKSYYDDTITRFRSFHQRNTVLILLTLEKLAKCCRRSILINHENEDESEIRDANDEMFPK